MNSKNVDTFFQGPEQDKDSVITATIQYTTEDPTNQIKKIEKI